MNLKHEMFWNLKIGISSASVSDMNLKHEMFWNITALGIIFIETLDEP